MAKLQILLLSFIVISFTNCKNIETEKKLVKVYIQLIDNMGKPIPDSSISRILQNSGSSFKKADKNGWVLFDFMGQNNGSFWVYVDKKMVGMIHLKLPNDKNRIKISVQPGFYYEIDSNGKVLSKDVYK